ncbi:MAG: DUF2905 domain-containing protein [Deltaproteobacteria bacterium]|nr:MAG: DUF2905 domain-containing protein [Deltaproteobacteria bacterium]
MRDGSSLGAMLLVLGAVLCLIGLLLIFAPKLPGWLFHLPGDLRWKRDGVEVYVPFTSFLILSVVLTLLLNLLLRFFGKD